MIGGIPHNGKGPAMVGLELTDLEKQIYNAVPTEEMKRLAQEGGFCPNKLAQFMEIQKHPELAGKGFMHWCEWCEVEKIKREQTKRTDLGPKTLDEAIAANSKQWFNGVTQGNSVG